ERDILAPAAARLASGVALTDLGRPVSAFKRLTDRHFKATKKQILGHVIHIDHYGNLITNIPKDIFDQVVGGRTYTVQFGSERSGRINTDYYQAEPGDSFLLFNSLGLLEIGISYGNATQLLGLGFDSPVNILFDE
ncbi:MAG: S-adenosyl-l-methionine hydroxide adenosyltransferase family protein, partial [Bacteroidota bacterium]